jgi:hypothetical protein
MLIKVFLALLPASFMEEREKLEELSMAKLKRRMEAGTDRADLIEGLLKRADEWV